MNWGPLASPARTAAMMRSGPGEREDRDLTRAVLDFDGF